MERPFTSSAEVFRWLSRFIDLERGQNVKSFRLERMELLAAAAGHPEGSAPAIHVAGSKGKGSVTGMISAILSAAGFETARYCSPHVREYRERITLGGRFFDESIYAGAGNELRGIAERVSAEPEYRLFNGKYGGEAPTFFELLTLYFFLCARLARCGVMAVETGMGGRLDPTNVVDPLASVITSIELEHTEYLGNTLAAVAGEKAGIVKPGKPLILAEQAPEALAVFKKAAAEKEAPLWYFPETAAIKNLKVSGEGTGFTLILENAAPLDLSLAIPGEVQARNAGLAVLTLRRTFPAVDDETVRRGLRDFTLPARFEKIRENPPVIIDGAHTPVSIALCTATFTGIYGEGGMLLFGCAAGKDARGMAEILVPHFSEIVITTPGNFKPGDPEGVYRVFKAAARDGKVILLPHTGEAVAHTLDSSRRRKLPVLGAGSFYLAAEIRKFAGKEPPGVIRT
jgi:dihydrofolate synthase/folylpolyglutamate synthase